MDLKYTITGIHSNFIRFFQRFSTFSFILIRFYMQIIDILSNQSEFFPIFFQNILNFRNIFMRNIKFSILGNLEKIRISFPKNLWFALKEIKSGNFFILIQNPILFKPFTRPLTPISLNSTGNGDPSSSQKHKMVNLFQFRQQFFHFTQFRLSIFFCVPIFIF